MSAFLDRLKDGTDPAVLIIELEEIIESLKEKLELESKEK